MLTTTSQNQTSLGADSNALASTSQSETNVVAAVNMKPRSRAPLVVTSGQHLPTIKSSTSIDMDATTAMTNSSGYADASSNNNPNQFGSPSDHSLGGITTNSMASMITVKTAPAESSSYVDYGIAAFNIKHNLLFFTDDTSPNSSFNYHHLVSPSPTPNSGATTATATNTTTLVLSPKSQVAGVVVVNNNSTTNTTPVTKGICI